MTTGMPVATSSCDNQKCLHVTAGWAQPLAGSHCCALLFHTLLLGNRSCSAVGWYLSRPCPQASINERLLVALRSYWSAPQWALPTRNCQWGTLGKWFSQGQWCGGHKVESEVRGRFRPSPGGPPVYPALGQWVRWWAQGPGWTLCPAGPEPSLSPSMPRPRPWGSSKPVCDLIAVSVCLGHSPWDLVSPTWAAWGHWGPVGLDAWLPQGWQVGREWGTWLWGAVAELCLLLAMIGTSEGESCALGLCPFSSGQSNIVLLIINK